MGLHMVVAALALRNSDRRVTDILHQKFDARYIQLAEGETHNLCGWLGSSPPCATKL